MGGWQKIALSFYNKVRQLFYSEQAFSLDCAHMLSYRIDRIEGSYAVAELVNSFSHQECLSGEYYHMRNKAWGYTDEDTDS